MIYIDDELRRRIDNALEDRCPMFIATVSPDGEPQISMRGSVLVFDRETLAFWERGWRQSAANIEENSKVVLFYRHPTDRINLRFYGTATMYRERRDPRQRHVPHRPGRTRPRPRPHGRRRPRPPLSHQPAIRRGAAGTLKRLRPADTLRKDLGDSSRIGT